MLQFTPIRSTMMISRLFTKVGVAITVEATLNILCGLVQPRLVETAIPIIITQYVASRIASQVSAVNRREPLFRGRVSAAISINLSLLSSTFQIHLRGRQTHSNISLNVTLGLG
ncbi:hypothetical protein [Ochrobactrum sp. EDr1-4]|uniref:hypothetical protein n=1 Tax=Ochrobactrum sp. EDr1-4 TaxID=3368622 RepID=UPI003B9E8DD5